MVSLAVGIVDVPTAVLAAVLAAFGIVLVVAGWFGLIPSFGTGLDFPTELHEVGVRLGFTAGGAIGLFAFTGWPVAGLFGGIAGWFFLTLKNAKRRRREAIDRVDAIATWVENPFNSFEDSSAISITQSLAFKSASNLARSIFS